MPLLCILVGGGSSAWGQETPYYTLNTNSCGNTTNSDYSISGTITVDDIKWAFQGNGQQAPWRLGGKNLSEVDRVVNTTTAMEAAISSIDLTVGTASSITVNSLTLVVASDDDFNSNSVLDEVSETFKANSTITFEPTRGSSWAKDAYYKFVFNVSVSRNTDKYVQFSKVEFYKYTGGGATPSITANNVDITSNATSGSIGYTLANATGNVSASITTGGDWLTSLGTVTASEVPFTCSANPGTTARTAEVTLSFTGAEDKVVTITQAAPIAMTANLADGAYWSTFYSNTGNFIAPEGTQVFAVNLTGTTLTLTEIEDRIVKSGQGVVLKQATESNETTTTITMTETGTTPTGDFSTNSLTGTMTSITNPGNAYVLSYQVATGVGFYQLSESGTIGALKAYLTYAGVSLAPAYFHFFEDVDGVEELQPFTVNREPLTEYDLMGRLAKPNSKGFRITKGHIMYVK